MQALIRADEGLKRKRRICLCSAINRASQLFGVEPADVPCDPAVLREHFRSLNHLQIGITPKYFANIQGNLSFALKRTGVWMLRISYGPISPLWHDLGESLEGHALRRGLGRFIRFSDDHGIAPEEVSDATSDAFRTALMERSFVDDPKVVHRRACRYWNVAVATVAGWPKFRMQMRSERWPSHRLPWESLPMSFRSELTHYLAWLGGQESASGRPAVVPRRPNTIKSIRKQIRYFAADLADAGFDPRSLTSLSQIVAIESVKAALQHRIERRGGEIVETDRAIAWTLVKIARDWVQVDPDHLTSLRHIRHRLGSQRVGLAESSHAALRQLDDDRNKTRLLRLPDALVDDAVQGGVDDIAAAIIVQIAVAIELLLAAPIVFERLVYFRLDQFVVRHDGTSYLTIPASQVRNGVEQTFALSQHTGSILETYLARFRPCLVQGDNPWMFPAPARDRVPAVTLRGRITTTIYRRTGLRFGPHQFRYLAAKLILDAEPGAYELVRQLLGHRQLKTTVNMCRGLETQTVMQRYDKILARLRGDSNAVTSLEQSRATHRDATA